MSLIHLEKVYSLKLANGHGWNLISTEGTELWMDRLAAIMELKSGELNEYPKLILIEERDKEKYEEPLYALEPYIQKTLPRSGWKSNIKINRFWYHSDVPDIIYCIGREKNHEDTIVRMWFLTYFIYQREMFSGGSPFHAGLVARNGQGVLLAANGGTGKSTCCRRIPSPWSALADDQTLIIRNHQEQYMVHPFPTWSEYVWKLSERTWKIESHVPLSAIFFLEQAKDDAVIPLEQWRAPAYIYELAMQGCLPGSQYMNKEEKLILRRRLFDNACKLAKTIPAYILRVSLHGRFWEEIERVL